MKKRIISAIVMIAIALPLIIIGEIPFKVAIIALALASVYELMKAKKKEKEFPPVIRFLVYLFTAATILILSYYNLDISLLIGIFLVFLIPIVLINDSEKYNITDAFFVMGTTLFISIALNGLITVRDMGFSNLLYLMLITIMTDTFALFSGMLIGKHKLCEKISPKKTIEGAIGGSLVGTVVPTLFYIFVIDSNVNILLIIIVTLVLSIIGQIGDLLFSSIKRKYDIKDFSNLIPGHGGILDRLDSLILVTLSYLILIIIL